MTLTTDELEYLQKVLSVTTSYTIAKAEQIDLPAVNHNRLLQKIEDQIHRRKS